MNSMFRECDAALERKTGVEQSLECLPSRACHRALPVKMHFTRRILVKRVFSFVVVVSPGKLLVQQEEICHFCPYNGDHFCLMNVV